MHFFLFSVAFVQNAAILVHVNINLHLEDIREQNLFYMYLKHFDLSNNSAGKVTFLPCYISGRVKTISYEKHRNIQIVRQSQKI